MDRPKRLGIDRLKERGVEKGSGRQSTRRGLQPAVFNQTNIGPVSKATLGTLPREGAERERTFPSAAMPA